MPEGLRAPRPRAPAHLEPPPVRLHLGPPLCVRPAARLTGVPCEPPARSRPQPRGSASSRARAPPEIYAASPDQQSQPWHQEQPTLPSQRSKSSLVFPASATCGSGASPAPRPHPRHRLLLQHHRRSVSEMRASPPLSIPCFTSETTSAAPSLT